MKPQTIILQLLCVGFLTTAKASEAAVPPPTPDLLFLLGGQSNMVGNGFADDLPTGQEYAAYRSPAPNVVIWDIKTKAWIPLVMGKKFGPEISFAHALSTALPDKHIGIIKYAAGGTSMDKWKPGGKLYRRLMNAYADARRNAPNAQLAAMLWHQGESDSDNKQVAEAYQDKLIRHITSIRKDTGNAELLFICAQINPAKTFRGQRRFLFADIVRKSQESLKLDHYLMIKTDDCEMNAHVNGARNTSAKEKLDPRNGDNIHYSAKGQIKMGLSFAKIYLRESRQEKKTNRK